MADGILGPCAFLFVICLDKACVMEKCSNEAKLNDSGGKCMALNMETMHKPGSSKCYSTRVFQVMVFCVAGAVSREFAVEEENYVDEDIFDK